MAFVLCGSLWLVSCNPLRLKDDQATFKSHCYHWAVDTSLAYQHRQVTLSTMLTESGKLIIDNAVGSIAIRPGKWSNVFVKGEIYLPEGQPLDSVSVRSQIQNSPTRSDSNFVYIYTDYRLTDRFDGFTLMDVFVPEELKELEIRSKSASITISQLNANLIIGSPCSNVIAREITGDSEIWVEYGNVILENNGGHVNIENIAGDVTLIAKVENGKTYDVETVSGTIQFIPRNNSGSISIATVSGRIDVSENLISTESSPFSENPGYATELRGEIEIQGEDIPQADVTDRLLQISAGKRSEAQVVEGRLGTGSARIYLNSTNGDIYVRQP